MTVSLTTDLEARYDAHQSFYGKAKVIQNESVFTLVSYGTRVANYSKDEGLKLLSAWNYSPTTLRHVKEFMHQVGYFKQSQSINAIRAAIANKEISEED